MLEVDGVFGGKEHGGAIVRGEEFDAGFGDGCELQQRHHLETVWCYLEYGEGGGDKPAAVYRVSAAGGEGGGGKEGTR